MPKTKNSPADSEIAPRLEKTDSGKVITLPLDEDGTVRWNSVRGSTKDKFKTILSSDPTALEMVAETLGDVEDVEPGEDSPNVPKITEANIGAIIDKVNLVLSFGVASLVGRFKDHPLLRDTKTGKPAKLAISPEVVIHSSKLTPEQHQELDPRALAVSQKYMEKLPDTIKKNFDLWMLGLMFFQFQAQNMGKMISTQVALDIKSVTQREATIKAGKPIPPDSDKVNGQATVGPSPEGESLEPGHVPNFPEAPRV